MSSTKTGLQQIDNKCINYGYQTKIKFNPDKIELVVSGDSNMKDFFIHVNDFRVRSQHSLTHLGFD